VYEVPSELAILYQTPTVTRVVDIPEPAVCLATFSSVQPDGAEIDVGDELPASQDTAATSRSSSAVPEGLETVIDVAEVLEVTASEKLWYAGASAAKAGTLPTKRLLSITKTTIAKCHLRKTRLIFIFFTSPVRCFYSVFNHVLKTHLLAGASITRSYTGGTSGFSHRIGNGNAHIVGQDNQGIGGVNQAVTVDIAAVHGTERGGIKPHVAG
jgi:hypothetical protein